MKARTAPGSSPTFGTSAIGRRAPAARVRYCSSAAAFGTLNATPRTSSTALTGRRNRKSKSNGHFGADSSAPVSRPHSRVKATLPSLVENRSLERPYGRERDSGERTNPRSAQASQSSSETSGRGLHKLAYEVVVGREQSHPSFVRAAESRARRIDYKTKRLGRRPVPSAC